MGAFSTRPPPRKEIRMLIIYDVTDDEEHTNLFDFIEKIYETFAEETDKNIYLNIPCNIPSDERIISIFEKQGVSISCDSKEEKMILALSEKTIRFISKNSSVNFNNGDIIISPFFSQEDYSFLKNKENQLSCNIVCFFKGDPKKIQTDCHDKLTNINQCLDILINH